MTGEEISQLAFDDFDRWCEERHPTRRDYVALAEEYAMDCENGSWVAGEATRKEGE